MWPEYWSRIGHVTMTMTMTLIGLKSSWDSWHWHILGLQSTGRLLDPHSSYDGAQVRIMASDWSKRITDQNTVLLLVSTGHMTRIVASDWSIILYKVWVWPSCCGWLPLCLWWMGGWRHWRQHWGLFLLIFSKFWQSAICILSFSVCNQHCVSVFNNLFFKSQCLFKYLDNLYIKCRC